MHFQRVVAGVLGWWFINWTHKFKQMFHEPAFCLASCAGCISRGCCMQHTRECHGAVPQTRLAACLDIHGIIQAIVSCQGLQHVLTYIILYRAFPHFRLCNMSQHSWSPAHRSRRRTAVVNPSSTAAMVNCQSCSGQGRFSSLVVRFQALQHVLTYVELHNLL